MPMSKSKQPGRPRKYFFNETCFDVLTPDIAYVLGLLWTLGTLKAAYPGIELSTRFLSIAQNFERILGGKDCIIPKKTSHRLCLTSKHAWNRLRELGLTPNKTFTIRFPDWAKGNLLAPFIRGAFDGHSSISPVGNSIQLNTSSADFANELQRVLGEEGITITVTPRLTQFILRVSRHSLVRFHSFLYPAPDVPACREKRELFERVLSAINA